MDNAQEKLLEGLEDLRKIAANNDLLLQMDLIQEKLLLAFEEQKKEISKNSPYLDVTFFKINDALASLFYNLLKSNPNISAEELKETTYQNSQWTKLTELMQRHYGLSDAERSAIMNRNGYRSNYGYGGPFLPTYSQIEKYAQVVRDLMERY
jgi:hypothetical protein